MRGDPVVLITGGAGTVGAALARMLASVGARLVLLDRNKEGLQALEEEMKAWPSLPYSRCAVTSWTLLLSSGQWRTQSPKSAALTFL
jgi:NADP-dependent 3-hydroxy acid dehydrogenase YdfG